MPHLCGSQTQTGGTCGRRVLQEGTKCTQHREREEQCSICLSDMTGQAKTLPCGHEFHRRCILAWRRRGENTCPLCRVQFTDTYTSNVLPDIVRQMNIVTQDALITEVVIDVRERDALIEVLHDLGIQTLPDSF
jgi:hypothetical protein